MCERERERLVEENMREREGDWWKRICERERHDWRKRICVKKREIGGREYVCERERGR